MVVAKGAAEGVGSMGAMTVETAGREEGRGGGGGGRWWFGCFARRVRRR